LTPAALNSSEWWLMSLILPITVSFSLITEQVNWLPPSRRKMLTSGLLPGP
jgi:hypothetical protein